MNFFWFDLSLILHKTITFPNFQHHKMSANYYLYIYYYKSELKSIINNVGFDFSVVHDSWFLTLE